MAGPSQIRTLIDQHKKYLQAAFDDSILRFKDFSLGVEKKLMDQKAFNGLARFTGLCPKVSSVELSHCYKQMEYHYENYEGFDLSFFQMLLVHLSF
jgi:hypothetical protein